MKKFLPLLGATLLVGLVIGLSGCILETTELTIVVSDFACTTFEEEHYNENYTDGVASLDDSFFEDLDVILLENELTKADIESVSVVGVYYKVLTGPTDPPLPALEWDVSGVVGISIDGGMPPVVIASYQHVSLSGPTDYIRIETLPSGLAVLDDAIAQYLDAAGPWEYPDITFYSGMENIDPSPTAGDPFIMTWDGCLSMRVAFTEEYETYDLFPG